MTGQEFLDIIKSGIFPIVEFNNQIEHWNNYFNERMIAQCVSYKEPSPLDEIVEVVFFTRPWDKHNTQVEKCNYYDEFDQPTLSSRQAGFHPEKHNWKESAWIGLNDPCPFRIIEQLTSPKS